ncbi:Tim44 domain-containing protein [Candidatus Pseudomonas adelgestsugas]|uniref:Tim44-like domain protein n=1 Tax=Candidatus Pseudomonas adelgestsugas TaxID=1302376 RepID=A0ABX5R882_9PSED|nr:TIM44-like domain-containing protein [Candidatus Pseudomonas adelgestsugas]QAX81390.1 Tim44-like domain protein [Candidatus Pseudomonas adelgestsugas]
MKRFFVITMALCLSMMASLDVNAKRFGGGKNIGSTPTHQTSQTTTAASNTSATSATTGTTSASRWLGPLAGIAAGGLLASMLMGGGFHGMQILDILIIMIVAFVIVRLIASRRRKQLEYIAPAGAPRQHEVSQPSLAMNSVLGDSATYTTSATSRAGAYAPLWFNEKRFLEEAYSHFQSLQQHWDANEIEKIAEFVTPQLLELLKSERTEIGNTFQSTYIENLHVQLDGIDDRADKTVATLTFSGTSKNSRFDQGEAFSESWNIERIQGDNQVWLVAGIRQNNL